LVERRIAHLFPRPASHRWWPAAAGVHGAPLQCFPPPTAWHCGRAIQYVRRLWVDYWALWWCPRRTLWLADYFLHDHSVRCTEHRAWLVFHSTHDPTTAMV